MSSEKKIPAGCGLGLLIGAGAMLVAMGGFVFLLLMGVMESDHALSVFGSSAAITVAAMFIMSAALERTGLIEALAGLFERVAGKSEIRVLLVLALWVSPWATRTSKEMINEATRTISVAGLQAGRFHQIASNDGVVYVETISEDGDSFTNAFIHTEKNGRKDVITADHGYQYVDPESGARYLALFDGFRSVGVPGQGDYRWMHFERNDIRLPETEDTGAVLAVIRDLVPCADGF